jgi:hypothetical protein
MSFIVEKPTLDSVNKSYILGIRRPPVFKVTTDDPLKPVFDDTTLNEFIDIFLKQSSPYFSKPLEKGLFLQRMVHIFNTDQVDLTAVNGEVNTSWIPAHVLFFTNRYEIHWILTEVEEIVSPTQTTPGNSLEADIPENTVSPVKPVPSESRQKNIRQKIRQARMKCALAKLHVERLAERYYFKYGNFDGLSDSDSELSSDFEFTSDEPPRKI